MFNGQLPKVARASQPWALGRNPIGIQERSAKRLGVRQPSGALGVAQGKRVTVRKVERGLRVRMVGSSLIQPIVKLQSHVIPHHQLMAYFGNGTNIAILRNNKANAVRKLRAIPHH